MTDIISRAKKLAKNGHTPGPWRASLLNGVRNDDGSSNFEGGIYPEKHGPPPIFLTSSGIDERDAHVIVFAAEAVEALAEETYQYGIEIFNHGGWEHQANVSGEPVWDEEKSYTENALDYFIQNGFTARIVRRRVSPVEVVDD